MDRREKSETGSNREEKSLRLGFRPTTIDQENGLNVRYCPALEILSENGDVRLLLHYNNCFLRLFDEDYYQYDHIVYVNERINRMRRIHIASYFTEELADKLYDLDFRVKYTDTPDKETCESYEQLVTAISSRGLVVFSSYLAEQAQLSGEDVD